MRAARKCLVKEWQKKELDEEEWFSRKKQMEEKKKTGEWLPPTDNVTALERQGSSIPRASTQYMQVFHTQVHSTRKYSTRKYRVHASIQQCCSIHTVKPYSAGPAVLVQYCHQ